MAFQQPEKVKSRIIKVLDRQQLIVYVDEERPAVAISVSGKMQMVYYERLKVGNEVIVELMPGDPSKGRLVYKTLDV